VGGDFRGDTNIAEMVLEIKEQNAGSLFRIHYGESLGGQGLRVPH